jgi:hypothetical protein
MLGNVRWFQEELSFAASRARHGFGAPAHA